MKKPPRDGTKVSVVFALVGVPHPWRVDQAVAIGGRAYRRTSAFYADENDPKGQYTGGTMIGARLTPETEGVKWCRGWGGARAAALEAAIRLTS